ncbi:hypothetical protein D3C81_1139230 [compost metagenome]
MKRDIQGQPLLPGQPIEHPDNRLRQFSQVGPTGAETQVSRFDPYDIENIPDQLQQTDRRIIGDFNQRSTGGFFARSPQIKLQQANNGIHWRADFMAHCREKSGFSPTCSICLVPGGGDFFDKLAALADVYPAADHALNFTA